MNLRDVRWLGAVAATIALCSAAWAGPFEDAQTRFKQGDYQGALTLLQQAQADQPKNPLVYAAMGQTYRKLNDPEDAKKAYDQVLQIDPNLRSIRQKSAFAEAYQSVGGDPSKNGGGQSTQNTSSDQSTPASGTAQDLIAALSTTGVYVAPGLRDQVNADALAQTVAQAQPRVLKIAIVGHTGNYPTRDALADDLRKRLAVPDDGVVLVATPNGVSGSSAKLSHDEIDQTLRQSGVDAAFASGRLSAAVTTAATALTSNIAADQRTSSVTKGGILFILLACIFALVLYFSFRKKGAMSAARGPIETMRQQVIAEFTYVDGYLDLLPAGADADNARKSRATAYERLSTANGVLQVAKSPDELRRAEPLLAEAKQLLAECRAAIDKATGGTGVALGVASDLPSTQTDAQRGRAYLAQGDFKPVETVGSASDRDRLQREIDAIPAGERGVSFFSGRPMPASELTPVTMVIGGQKRTVMATRDEAAAIARGETPHVRAFADAGGHYTPWYEYRGYDPYRDYYGGSNLGTLVDLYILTDLLGPATWGGYGPWGYGGFGWGMPMPTIYDNPGFYGAYDGAGGGYASDFGGGNVGGSDFFGSDAYNGGSEPANAGGMDFFGQNGGNDPGAGFDTTPDTSSSGFDFGGGSDSSGGGFDFGGGDSGGGFDFGGGDSGGGFDSGGGGDSGGF